MNHQQQRRRHDLLRGMQSVHYHSDSAVTITTRDDESHPRWGGHLLRGSGRNSPLGLRDVNVGSSN
ncbi:hypothetical protein PF010_g30162 [Phytophthora fragariae]|uniref:Uncharacterized protein n=1 Tax=Phytophthora fragariae TaxID=53985 RepID=A0A6A3GVL6_9STRA|nr:hypothetical protein PF003_g9117 [Phytophthora fragariae]KAE8961126.1 hypothetical protein PF011_g29863 [Phytophthora fragariae]KAE9060581.1 hypothetical protein PF010_g30162 [Phytophthora fragariae]KAE9063219.1 hypothetical protein PF007_g29622 [Phytophthora fragariae]KAE9066912.1 hypothetical protein PF006_g30107 [Phytophthora fragariae]